MRHRLADDRGAGSVLALAVIGAVVALVVGIVPVLAILVDTQRAANAADAAALAAADATSGAVATSGSACELAGRVARRGGAEVVSCEIDGLEASVAVRLTAALFPVTARARAGPPPP
ncbi:helicase [Agromyces protaetiae]|uniref:Helicase n=1 Tax=Agromyces protaetiae TaxID=2509455 RepID=A0A4P6FIS2_9MICO|nr:helicase [Agromyces protaetiae]